MSSILIVEDDRSLAQGIELALQEASRRFTLCHDLASARAALACQAFDLMILDISLPDGSGLQFCKEMRAAFPAPILFLTANDTEWDIVAGLETGGDDYITKPFSLAVLRARVHALLRRGTASANKFVCGDITLDFECLRFTKGGVALVLSKTEQRLLHILVSNPGQTITRERLLDYVWSQSGEFVDENALSVSISRLRGKLEEDPANPKHIKTIRGLGYGWVVAT